MSGLTFASLCTGIGGFDLGWQRAGMECVFQCEQEPSCNVILERHYSHVPRTKDVNSDETAEQHVRLRPDWLCFGFPCQDLSVAGRRAGLAGERSGLFFRCAELASLCGARGLVIENVPGLLSSNGGRDMGIVLSTLGDMGYRWSYRVLDSQWFGLAQRRKRVFIVGSLGDGRCSEILFESEGVLWDSAPRREAGTRVAGEIAACLNSGGNNGGLRTEPGEHLVASTLNCLSGVQDDDRMNYVVQDTAFTVASRDSKGVNSNANPGNLVIDTFQADDYANGSFENTDCARPMTTSPDRSRAAPVTIQNHAVRRLTEVECERLQGFPDNWTAGLSGSARYRALGNAVSVPVAEWIGRRIISTPEPERTK